MRIYLRYACPQCYTVFQFENSMPKEFICLKCKKELKGLEIIEEIEKKAGNNDNTRNY